MHFFIDSFLIFILILQAVCDSLFLIFVNLVYTSASILSPSEYLPLLHLIPTLVPLIQIFLTASVYTTLAVAVERFLTLHGSCSRVQGQYFSYG